MLLWPGGNLLYKRYFDISSIHSRTRGLGFFHKSLCFQSPVFLLEKANVGTSLAPKSSAILCFLHHRMQRVGTHWHRLLRQCYFGEMKINSRKDHVDGTTVPTKPTRDTLYSTKEKIADYSGANERCSFREKICTVFPNLSVKRR